MNTKKPPAQSQSHLSLTHTHIHSLSLLSLSLSLSPGVVTVSSTMKVETPQILWHNIDNKNAPILSLSLVDVSSETSPGSFVLATAGGSEVHLWKLSLRDGQHVTNILQRKHTTRIEHLVTLSRHDSAVNAVRFSPDGLHLATAGDASSLVMYSVPPHKRGNSNGKHYWSTVENEKDLRVRIVSSGCEEVYDLDWSADSKRLVVGTIDHTVVILEDTKHDGNRGKALQDDSEWRAVYHNRQDHTHYVQGVAYDPLGVYVASMSCDRTVQVYPRTLPNLEASSNKKKSSSSNSESNNDNDNSQLRVADLLTKGQVQFGKTKQIKYRCIPASKSNSAAPNTTTNNNTDHRSARKQLLFLPEEKSEGFFRRLRFTQDGAYLVTPCALWQKAAGDGRFAQARMATLLFARHKYDQPCTVLLGMDEVSTKRKH